MGAARAREEGVPSAMADHKPALGLLKQHSWSPDTERDEAWLRRKGLHRGRRSRFERSVNDEDLDELCGCFDLGFGFDIVDPHASGSCATAPGRKLSKTFPALDLFYAVHRSCCDSVARPLPSDSSSSSADDGSPTDNPLCISSPVSLTRLDRRGAFLEHICVLASLDGHPIQRVASHLAEALSRRILRSLPGVYRTLLPAAAFPLHEAVAARRHFLDLFPFLHVAFAVSNWAIMEAMDEEKMIHIIDLNASDPTQWIFLLQALGNRRGGAPHLRITFRAPKPLKAVSNNHTSHKTETSPWS